MNNEMIDYAERFTSGESELLSELRRHCYENYADSNMLSGYFQGRILAMLSNLVRPKLVLEIGTYLGYSTLSLAEGLAVGGRVITLDIQPETNEVARAFAARSQYSEKIDFRLGDALKMIPTLDVEFDLVFIDADKPNYSNYFDLVFDKLRLGGIIIADNVLWSGRVLDDEKDESTLALHNFNQKVLVDARVENVLLPIRDGLMIVRKIAT